MKDKDTSHPNYVGQRIRQLRKSKGVTQDYVSELAGITSGYLGHIERGEKTQSLSTLAKIANALDTTVESLLAAPLSEKDKCIRELVDIVSGMPVEMIDSVTKHAAIVRETLENIYKKSSDSDSD